MASCECSFFVCLHCGALVFKAQEMRIISALAYNSLFLEKTRALHFFQTTRFDSVEAFRERCERASSLPETVLHLFRKLCCFIFSAQRCERSDSSGARASSVPRSDASASSVPRCDVGAWSLPKNALNLFRNDASASSLPEHARFVSSEA